MLYNSATSMPSSPGKRFLLIAAAVGLSILGLGGFLAYAGKPKNLIISADRQSTPADGNSMAIVRVKTDMGPLRGRLVSTSFVPGKSPQVWEEDVDWEDEAQVPVRAGIMPGEMVVEVKVGQRKIRKTITLTPTTADRFGDGFPDFLRLADEQDRKAFRQWSTLLAELQMTKGEDDLPKEITDCSSLLRFAYRESLWRHSDEWKKANMINGVYEPASINAYELPYTPLGPKTFRVKDGVFTEDSLKDGSFAEFADAKTLMSLNAHFVSRDIAHAEQGDLLFYRQLEQESPFHSMIYVGRSHFRNIAERSGVEEPDWIVYHTGPVNGSKGQMKKVTVAELARHPDPKWRPVKGNSNFLGVFRWNILREAR